jgi:dihydrofolate synthase/folylpolyglutamate synthase
MLASIFHSSGFKVGLFTSPHLLSFEERIRINGSAVPRDKLCSLVEKIKPISEEMVKSGEFEHPTFFETATAMALKHFSDENVDYAVVEVGLGGRLDATNVVTPLVSVITTIALDHTHVLGTSLEEVTREKAGIIKPRVPVVVGIEDEVPLAIMRKICEERKSEMYLLKELASPHLKESNLDGHLFDLELGDAVYNNLKINLLGRHQLKNAQTAAATLHILRKQGIIIKEEDVRSGFKNTRWPGRLEIVRKNPTVILDCAHNPAGMKALRGALNELFGGKKLTLVIGIMRDKDIPGIIKEIAIGADNIIVTKPEFERAAEPGIIESEVRRYCKDVIVIEKVAAAVNYAIKNALEEDVICITGSIFNVAEAMGVLGIDS